MSPSDVLESRSRKLVILVFTLVGLAALAATAFASNRTLALENHSREIVDNALTSVRLVDRIDHDVSQRRILLDRHIYATDPHSMADIESELLRTEADLSATKRAYEPWATYPGERETWEKVKALDDETKAPIERALELSRANRDAEARAVLMSTTDRLAELRANLNQLVVINDQAANQRLATISRIRRSLVDTFLAIGLATLIGLVVLGRWSVRQIAHRAKQAAQYMRALEERNRDLDAFAGRVAHDIRGPLSTLSLAATQLRQAAPEHGRTAELLRRGVLRMEALVEDLLALARVEATRRWCDPAVVSSRIQDEFGSRVAAEKGSLRVAVDHASVRCSDGLLQQALANLLENAVKYRRPEAALQVEISGAPSERGYDLRVTDNGLGMSPEDAGRAFEPFFRSQRTRDLPGTGLGLSIVKRVVDASGGTVSVASQLGRGSSFVVHLPLAAEEGA